MATREWWRDAVIYQIYPRSFQDDNGDGVGDLQGIARRLPHVAELGADAIWLSPIFTSPMADMGYDVSNYTDIDPLFGTLADFDELIATAHDLGLKVIVDQVLSHSSSAHPFFEESRASRTGPKADWYVWADPKPDGSPPNNWASVFGGSAWEWEPRRRQYYLHNFLTSQPDFNFHNPEVQDWLLSTMEFWLERGLDGFRLDTVNYYFHNAEFPDNPPGDFPRDDLAKTPRETYPWQRHLHDKNQPENLAFLERMRSLCDRYDDIMMVGEVGEDGDRSIEVMAEYTRGTDRLHMAYSFAMLSPEFTADHFRRCIAGFLKGAPDGWPKWSFSNHDVVRHVTRWKEHARDQDTLAKQAVAMLMSFPGTIGIYQGEELGQTDTELVYSELTDPPALRFWPEVKGRDGCRTPMVWEAHAPSAGFSAGTPWLPVKAPQADRAVDRQAAQNDSVLAAYKAAIAYRKHSAALTRGTTDFLDLPEPFLAFRRADGHGALTCVFNLSPEHHSLALGGPARLDGPHHASLDAGTLSLPPNGYAYLAHEGVLTLKA
ncbi:alpha-amylase family glycosyl hydrolase [Histidinibacterium lentulum]|uniref:Alpha-glucosidase n=1 Tax=Histidinibacterium lentulum TaxID=2480588 RepID=A0A3N2R0N8_9RHOB|nr:alpha-amylase family glycosyl hydrolase [Histidinibacterium lentulum]ROU01035.1 alpha-glucosidase [Histidinibacterium lentulum]